MYKIYGKYQDNAEYIDESNTLCEVTRLVQEYKMAFGMGWEFWIVTENNTVIEE